MKHDDDPPEETPASTVTTDSELQERKARRKTRVTNTITTVTLNPSPATFPVTEAVSCGLWAALSSGAKAVLPVLWDWHRRFEGTCHPSRETISREAGVSVRTISRALIDLEQVGLLTVLPAPGPGANTYELSWSNLRVPKMKDKANTARPNAFSRSEGTIDILVGGEEGRQGYVSRVGKGHIRTAPDGCMLRSGDELDLHQWLDWWGLPHAANVGYSDLGIYGLHALAAP